MRVYVPAICLTLRHNIRFRFQCERCDKDSGWREKEFTRSFTFDSENATQAAQDASGRITDEGLANAQRQAHETGNSLLACDIYPTYLDAQKGVFPPGVFGGKCPHCSKYQTWAATASIWQIFKTSLIISIVLSLMIIGFMYAFLTYNEYAHWSFYSAIPIFLIVFVPSAISIGIKKLLTKEVDNPQKPVIDWNGYVPPKSQQ